MFKKLLEFCKQQKPMGINQWLEIISKNKLYNYQHTILECANSLDLIIVDHNASFTNSIIS